MMKLEKNLALLSMLFGISALFIFPGIIIIEVLCKIESLPLSYTILGNASVIFAVLGWGLGCISKDELKYSRESVIVYKIMSVTGIVCSVIMIALLTLSVTFMILEELHIFKLFA